MEEDHGGDDGVARVVVHTDQGVAEVFAVGFAERFEHGGFDLGQGG